MNEEYLKELIVGIRVFLWMLSIKIKALSLTEFWKLLEGCSSQQKLYAVWLGRDGRCVYLSKLPGVHF